MNLFYFIVIAFLSSQLMADEIQCNSNIDSINMRNNINNMIDKINREIQKEKHSQTNLKYVHRQQIGEIENTLKCMKSKVSQVSMKCHDRPPHNKPTAVARVSYKKKDYVLFSLTEFDNTINLYPHFNNIPINTQVGVLLHEVSHFCGTKDPITFFDRNITLSGLKLNNYQPSYLDYYEDKILKKFTYSKVDPVISADHYRIWGMYSFCITTKGCEENLLNLKARNTLRVRNAVMLKNYYHTNRQIIERYTDELRNNYLLRRPISGGALSSAEIEEILSPLRY